MSRMQEDEEPMNPCWWCGYELTFGETCLCTDSRAWAIEWTDRFFRPLEND